MFNPNDAPGLITDTVNVINTLFKSKTIFYVLNSWERKFSDESGRMTEMFSRLTEESKNEQLSFYHDKLKLPVVDITDERQDSLVLNLIENFFK